jgi:hypothetical protein
MELPLLLAGPIIRRAETKQVCFWVATSAKVERVSAIFFRPRASHRISGLVVDIRTVRLGQRLWTTLMKVKPPPGQPPFPQDTPIEYELVIKFDKLRETLNTSSLKLAYEPFRRPTFILPNKNACIAQGSCRRPEGRGPDAMMALDVHLQDLIKAGKDLERPSALFLTGDQIYADDVAKSRRGMFEATFNLSYDAMGYCEAMPGSGNIDPRPTFLWKWHWDTDKEELDGISSESRKWLTATPGKGKLGPIGFTTEDGEGHLLSLGEYCAMYLLVWNPDLLEMYWARHFRNDPLGRSKTFAEGVKSCRRVMANTPTYMIFDDHEVTDDWNLNGEWEAATKSDALAKRILSNAGIAYWAFQGWGNDPLVVDEFRAAIVDRYCRRVLDNIKGVSRVTDRSAYTYVGAPPLELDQIILPPEEWPKGLLEGDLESTLTFAAPTNPPALFLDTRTKRTQLGRRSPTLISLDDRARIAKFLRTSASGQGWAILVTPNPILPHPVKEFGVELERTLKGLREKIYEYDLEEFAQDSLWAGYVDAWTMSKRLIAVFSGDVHFGYYCVVGDSRSLKNRPIVHPLDNPTNLVQICSSPIKNEPGDWDYGSLEDHAGKMDVAEEEIRESKKAAVYYLDGNPGASYHALRNHVCIVDFGKCALQQFSAGANAARELSKGCYFLGVANDPPKTSADLWFSRPRPRR